MRRVFLYVILPFVLMSCVGVPKKQTNMWADTYFAPIWNCLDTGYVYFNENAIDWDDLYDRYASKLSSAVGESLIRDIQRDVVMEIKDPSLQLISNTTYQYPLHAEDQYFYAWSKNKNSLYEWGDSYQQGNFICNTISQPTLNGLRSYIYIAFIEGYFRVGDDLTNVFSSVFSNPPYDGVILDLRSNSVASDESMLSLAECFYSRRVHDYAVGYIRETKKDRTKLKRFATYSLFGNEYFVGTPVSVIVNEATCLQANKLAYMLSELPNTVTIGQTCTAGGGGITRKQKINLEDDFSIVVEYPYIALYSPDGKHSFNKPLRPTYLLPQEEYNQDPSAVNNCIWQAIQCIDSMCQLPK